MQQPILGILSTYTDSIHSKQVVDIIYRTIYHFPDKWNISIYGNLSDTGGNARWTSERRGFQEKWSSAPERA